MKLIRNTKLLSLLYFSTTFEEVQQIIQDESIDSQDNDFEDALEGLKLPDINDVDLTKVIPNLTVHAGDTKTKPYIHPGERTKKKRGDKAENIAYKALVEKYGKDRVVRKSKEDDSAGYDLKYKDSDDNWKYVEVKSHSGNLFYITRNELEFANTHKGEYEIFLVGENIFRITEVDFLNTSLFKLTPKEFIVEYSL